MKRKQIVDLTTAVFLILIGMVTLIMPLIAFVNIKIIFSVILVFYALVNLLQFIHTYKDRDYEGLFTAVASLLALVIILNLNIALKPWYLAISLFVWVILMSLIKLKKTDYYHDRNNIVWIVRVITLVLFITTGILATINLYYTEEVQTLVLGFFFYIHGILELIDPLSVYLKEKKD